MKKRTLFILLIVLTVVFATFASTVAFAEDGETTETFTKTDLIKLIVTYCVFGVSIVVGIPAIRAVNKRKKKGYIEDIVKETNVIADKLSELYQARGGANSKRNNIKYAIKIATVADMALTTYTEKQIAGFYEVYNELSELNSKLGDLDKSDKDYDKSFESLVTDARNIAEKAQSLAENENIIRQYNK